MQTTFRKYIYPALFGLLVYAVVRVLNDTISGFRFWKRPWPVNAIEITCAIGLGYALHFSFKRLFRHYDKKLQRGVGYKAVLHELLWVTVFCELGANAIMTPMAALTDDGLSWGDFAMINIIPLLFCLIHYAINRSNKLLEIYVNNRLQLEKLTNDHLQTELKFLKAQYHPHFLFNALNTVYFQMDEDVEGAKRTVEKFSELLRYQLYDQQQTVPVSRELAYLRNYMELQQIRSSQKLRLEVQLDPTLNGQQVYPLLLLPLVENAFKYVGGQYHLYVEAAGRGTTLYFKVVNSIPEQLPVQKAGGIGLENLKRRLELLYPQKHSLHIEKTDDQYAVTLTLSL